MELMYALMRGWDCHLTTSVFRELRRRSSEKRSLTSHDRLDRTSPVCSVMINRGRAACKLECKARA